MVQFELKKKQHNELFPKRKIKWNERYEYYYDKHRIHLHKFTNIKGKIVVTLLFPISVLFYGVGNIKESFRDLKRMYNEKKYGSFVSDYVNSESDTYIEVMKLIKK